MSKELDESLVAIIGKVSSGVESGIDFLSAQLPPVLEQLLLWKMCSSLLGLLISAALLFCSIRVLCNIFTSKKGSVWRECGFSDDADYSTSAAIAAPIFVFVAAVSAASGLHSASTALQIWLAPKVYLIEYAARLAS